MRLYFLFLSLFLGVVSKTEACSILYYVDAETGKIYIVNNEDYWYDTDAYIQIEKRSKKKLARLWYGWDDFAQGGVNEAGLFFDAAVTPEQEMPEGYHKPKGNFGDDILAHCKTVEEAIQYLEKEKTAVSNGHMLFGDLSGNAAVIEWVRGEMKIVPITNNRLIATNFLLSDTLVGDNPCYRYASIDHQLDKMEKGEDIIDLQRVGNCLGGACQPPRKDADGRKGGTLYTNLINLTDMEMVVVYKLDRERIQHFDLNKEFERKRRKKIRFE